MTKRRRMFVIWTCCACLWTPALYFVWLRVAIHSTSAWGAAAEQVFEFGAFRWCTLQHDPAKAAPALAITWGFDLAGAVLNLAMTAGLALIASPFVRWLVRNSALQGRCDRCGCVCDGSTEPARCTECGEELSVEKIALAITTRSAFHLLASLVLLGGAGLVSSVAAILSTTFHVGSLAIDPGAAPHSPQWWSNGIDLLLLGGLLLSGAFLFCLWFYREPSKHPPDRALEFFKRWVR